jgi:hypothetical protein
MALALYVFVSACLDYHRMRQYDDWWSRTSSVGKYTRLRLRSAADTLAATQLRDRIVGDYDPRDAVQLRVENSAWQHIRRDVGGTWGEWIDATIVEGNDFHPVEIRLRGDNSVHWTSEKKSLSVKTPRDQLYKGYRRLIFSLKAVLPQHLTNSLAQDFGLLAPKSDVVPLFVNGHYYGIFRFIEPVDESFLRNSGRMPGNIFRGDAAVRGERFKNLPRPVFLNPYAWDRVAENTRPDAPQGALFGFLSEMTAATAADHRRFMSQFDRDELARLLALMLISGDPYHMSDVHNQLWYEDPATGMLHPIVWDLRLLRLDRPRDRFGINRFWLAALRDPRIFDASLRHIDAWLEDGALERIARERVETAYDRYADHFEYDLLRAGTIYASPGPELIMDFVRDNTETLQRWLDTTDVAYLARESGDAWTVDLRVSGRAGGELAALTCVAPSGAGGCAVYADSDLDGALGPDDRLVPAIETEQDGVTTVRLEEREVLLPGCTAHDAGLVQEPLHYRFFLVPGAAIDDVHVELVARDGETPLEPRALEPGNPVAPRASWHPWELLPIPGEDVRLAGDAHLAEDLVVEEGGTLFIEAGTTLTLDPGVSVLVRGQLVARGKQEQPIRVRPAVQGAPWGVFALQGRGADGSRLEYVHFEGGGGARLGAVEYKGSVCVHDASDVEFVDCTLARNQRCDDLLNVVSADVDLLRCRFTGANADAIDYDLSVGEIVDCVIEGAPNDGIDLMTSSPRIVGTRIAGCGDKGISFGEECAPVVIDCDVTGCARGLEVKDFSEPVLLRSRITGNGLGLLERSKNWRYGGGGHAKLIATLLEGNEQDQELLDGSQLTVAELDEPLLRHLFGAGEGEPSFLIGRLWFEEDFGEPGAGWARSGNVDSLRVRGRDLVARFVGGAGTIAAVVDWDIPADADAHVLLVEVAGEGLSDVTLSAGGATTEVSVPVKLRPDGVFGYAALELPAGHYTGLALHARAVAGGGQLRLHGYRVFDVPRRSP